MTSAHGAIIDIGHALCDLAPENRHRAAQQRGAADGAAVRQQSGNGRVIHRLLDAPRLEHGRRCDKRPWVTSRVRRHSCCNNKARNDKGYTGKRYQLAVLACWCKQAVVSTAAQLHQATWMVFDKLRFANGNSQRPTFISKFTEMFK